MRNWKVWKVLFVFDDLLGLTFSGGSHLVNKGVCGLQNPSFCSLANSLAPVLLKCVMLGLHKYCWHSS